MKPYDPKQIEEKWMKHWREAGLFQGTAKKNKGKRVDKFYDLYAFAYPSAAGLHVGHAEPLTAVDILARYHRMDGREVFFPVGWDAFGLPAENYAIKTGVHPQKTTKDAIHAFEKQVERLGISFDWETEIATSDPTYYKWTQWIFIQLFKAGLAYRDKGYVNWCPQDKTVLANEQVVSGCCERCGSKVIQKELEQWKFRITQYQDELIEGLSQVDWPKSTREQQINWIGKSEGAEVKFQLSATDLPISCFTTRLDTIYGVTFLVVSPEKFKALNLLDIVSTDRKNSVASYLDSAFHKTEEERRVGEKDKSGVDTGLLVLHPLTGAEIPVWVADYVLAGYGTGSVMGVPGHDARDRGFAEKFGLPIKEVVKETGTLFSSGEYSGLSSSQAVQKLLKDNPEKFQKKTSYKLRDWLISRQRYWGAPIPMVYCEACAQEGKGQRGEMLGWYTVPESDLPVKLPELLDFRPTDDGRSPIEKANDSWKFIQCPGCQGKAKREVDTMDTFVDSSWYFLRYTDPRNPSQFASKPELKQWLPVDFYLIGAEHTVLHLLYSRFFVKFLRDLGYLSFDEPFLKMRHQGMILGPDGKKMSKSKGNVINPDDIIEKFGADTLRVYEMFMGPLDADKAWDTFAVAGVYRFLTRVHKLVSENPRSLTISDAKLERKLHKTIKKVGTDIANYHFNTAIAALMEFCNAWAESLSRAEGLSSEDLANFVKIIAPLAPFLAEELYHEIKGTQKALSVHTEAWPIFNPNLAQDEEIEIVVQVNAKVRGRFMVSTSNSQDKEALKRTALLLLKELGFETEAAKHVVVVPGKLVNVVI